MWFEWHKYYQSLKEKPKWAKLRNKQWDHWRWVRYWRFMRLWKIKKSWHRKNHKIKEFKVWDKFIMNRFMKF